jgi:cytochrome b subunit of formate dehydrogenase
MRTDRTDDHGTGPGERRPADLREWADAVTTTLVAPGAPTVSEGSAEAPVLLDPRFDRRRMLRPGHTDRRLKPRSAKAHLFVTICHWTMTLLLGLNLVTGMRLGWGYNESPLGGMEGVWGRTLAALSPKGTLFGINILTLHVTSAFLMLFVVGLYVGYLIKSRSSQRLKFTRTDMQKLIAGLRSRQFWRNKAALWSANLLVYWIAFAFIVVLVVTGVALYRLDLGLSTVLGGYSFTRLLHAVVGYLFIPYVVLHSVLQWFFGRFWTIFKAQLWWPHVRAGLIASILAIPVVAGAYLLDDATETLTAIRLTGELAAPVLDGDPGDPVWARAEAAIFRTVKGMNNPHDLVDVAVKAVHDGQYVYFQFQWADPDASYKRFPLLKTENGWKVLQSAFENSDESVYYEDKLSVYFTDVRNGSCATTCHVGAGPHADRNEKHGLHYTTGGETGDVWHWKSVRTNFVGELQGQPGYLDDQYFGPPTPIKNPKDRYTGGYYADPDQGGGYSYNFVKVDPSKRLADTYVVPKLLPPSLGIAPNVDPRTSEHGVTWWIHKSQGIPYTKEADTYPVGTLIPNIIVSPFTGDRADVRAKAEWRQGVWTLEARRVLDTKSGYDVPFVPGQPVYVTVATYNRTQVRHGEHIKPIRLMLQP